MSVREARMSEIAELQKAIELEYQTQLLLIDLHPDRDEIYRMLEEMKEPPKNAHEKQLYDRWDRRLNTITDENFKKIIEKLPEEQAQALIEARKAKGKHAL
jgi:hypothetical protein